MDTLAVQLYTSLLPRRIRDFHPLERAHGAQTVKTDHGSGLFYGINFFLLVKLCFGTNRLAGEIYAKSLEALDIHF